MQAQEDANPPKGQANAGAGDDAGGEYGEVTQFLQSIALDKYKDRFIENGIED